MASKNSTCIDEKSVDDDLHNTDASDSDCEIDDDYIENLAIEHQTVIEKYMKNLDVLDDHKAKINSLVEEKKKFLEKIR